MKNSAHPCDKKSLKSIVVFRINQTFEGWKIKI